MTIIKRDIISILSGFFPGVDNVDSVALAGDALEDLLLMYLERVDAFEEEANEAEEAA